MKTFFLSIIFTIILITLAIFGYTKYIFSEKDLILALNNNKDIPFQVENISIKLLHGITLENVYYSKEIPGTNLYLSIKIPTVKLKLDRDKLRHSQELNFDNITFSKPIIELTDYRITFEKPLPPPEKHGFFLYLLKKKNIFSSFNKNICTEISGLILNTYAHIDSKKINIKNASIKSIKPLNLFKILKLPQDTKFTDLDGECQIKVKNKEFFFETQGLLNKIKTTLKGNLDIKPKKTDFDIIVKNHDLEFRTSLTHTEKGKLKINSSIIKYKESRMFSRGEYDVNTKKFNLNIISTLSDEGTLVQNLQKFAFLKLFNVFNQHPLIDLSLEISGATNAIENWKIKGLLDKKHKFDTTITFKDKKLSVDLAKNKGNALIDFNQKPELFEYQGILAENIEEFTVLKLFNVFNQRPLTDLDFEKNQYNGFIKLSFKDINNITIDPLIINNAEIGSRIAGTIKNQTDYDLKINIMNSDQISHYTLNGSNDKLESKLVVKEKIEMDKLIKEQRRLAKRRRRK